MSIVPLRHATVLAPVAEKQALLARLQALGCLHVIGFDGPGAVEIDARVHAAYRYLAVTPLQRHRVRYQPGFDPAALVERIEALRVRITALEEERDALLRRIRDIGPWGHFHLHDLEGRPELRLWFYRLPPGRMAALEASGHVWKIVDRTFTEYYVVVVAAEEPSDLPFARVHVGSRTLAELEARLAEVEVEIDDAEADRAGCTRWTDLFASHLDRLLDAAARDHAVSALQPREALVLVRGWVPVDKESALEAWVGEQGFALLLRDPAPDETPPTLLANPPMAAAGSSLVRFFTTPAYRAWDPSVVVMGSFVLFFAMILGDAVYGIVLCAALAFAWRAMGRSPALRPVRVLAVLLALGTTAWGLMSGNYAGLPPPSALDGLRVIPAGDPGLMMNVALATGLLHLAIANGLAAWHLRLSPVAWARVGWVGIFAAAALWQPARAAAYVCGGLGLLLILLFTSEKRGFGPRLAEGAMALPRLVSVVGDTLSYLRLFALGIATASLAAAFNGMAGSLSTVPGPGVVLGLLVLLAGHGINLVLGVAGGVIHGLRLNYIEFFGWSLWDDGRPFIPFQQREHTG